MQNYLRKVIEKTIDWAVPAVCAAALVVWKDIPADLQHYWPVVCVAIQGLCSLVIAHQNRKEVRRLRAIHEKADAKEADRKAIDDSIQKAFRAMLDDQMGSLYASCVAKGYTTEDERRRYDRLQTAYEGCGGNGEAKRRKNHFEAIIDEETWKAQHPNNN